MISNIDIKSIMNFKLKKLYRRQVELFISNMFVLKDISIDDIIQYDDISLYRDVKLFVRKIKHVVSQHDFNVY